MKKYDSLWWWCKCEHECGGLCDGSRGSTLVWKFTWKCSFPADVAAVFVDHSYCWTNVSIYISHKQSRNSKNSFWDMFFILGLLGDIWRICQTKELVSKDTNLWQYIYILDTPQGRQFTMSGIADEIQTCQVMVCNYWISIQSLFFLYRDKQPIEKHIYKIFMLELPQWR